MTTGTAGFGKIYAFFTNSLSNLSYPWYEPLPIQLKR